MQHNALVATVEWQPRLNARVVVVQVWPEVESLFVVGRPACEFAPAREEPAPRTAAMLHIDLQLFCQRELEELFRHFPQRVDEELRYAVVGDVEKAAVSQGVVNVSSNASNALNVISRVSGHQRADVDHRNLNLTQIPAARDGFGGISARRHSSLQAAIGVGVMLTGGAAFV